MMIKTVLCMLWCLLSYLDFCKENYEETSRIILTYIYHCYYEDFVKMILRFPLIYVTQGEPELTLSKGTCPYIETFLIREYLRGSNVIRTLLV